VKDRARRLDRLKNRSEKCEGPAEGVVRLKNRSEKCEGPCKGAWRVKEPE
jgi:hypothetical protein